MGVLSDDKANHLAHCILTSLKGAKQARLQGEDSKTLRTIKRVLSAELAQEVAIDQMVRKRLASYAKPIVEGSQEWDVMYRKCAEEELRKHLRPSQGGTR